MKSGRGEEEPGRGDGEKPARREEKDPASDEVIEVAPGVLRLQLPVNMPGIGHVNCYALCDGDGVALVDPGMHGKASWAALLDRLDRAGIPLKRVHTTVVTHSHFDHYGGCHQLLQEAEASLLTHEAFSVNRALELLIDDIDPSVDDGTMSARVRSEGAGGAVPGGERVRSEGAEGVGGSRVQGMPWGPSSYTYPVEIFQAWLRTEGEGNIQKLRPPTPGLCVGDGAVIELAGREWFALHTPGHTADHLCLWDPTEGVLLSGDHVLPTVTPHIAGSDSTEFDDPLASFLDSLKRVEALDGSILCLPAHGHPFSGLRERARAIRRHHDEHLDMLRHAGADRTALADAPAEAFMEVLFPRRVWGYMAASETYAHLEHLRVLGEAVARRDSAGAMRYRMRRCGEGS